MNRYDVVISGGGMVGLVTALALTKSGRSVCLLERGQFNDWQAGSKRGLRVSALAQSHMQWFESLGMANHWVRERLGHYRAMKVWDNRSTAAIEFDSSHSEYAHLGAMVENDHVIATAIKALQNTDADVRMMTLLTEFERDDKQVRVTLSSGETLKAGLLLSAEGASSMIREKAGITVTEKSYQQKGLVCYVKLNQSENQTAYQAFNPTGPVGLLPVEEGLFSIVWSLDDAEVDRWLTCDAVTFERGLKAHINRDLGMPKLLSERVAFPLKQQQASAYHQGRVVLLGDAAHVLHPLAGQGVNLGLADGHLLVDLLEGINFKDELALMRVLKTYQRRRRAQVAETQMMVDGLHHLFTRQQAPLPLLRAWGLNTINQMNMVKSWLMKQAGS